jgi:hypothetical protein
MHLIWSHAPGDRWGVDWEPFESDNQAWQKIMQTPMPSGLRTFELTFTTIACLSGTKFAVLTAQIPDQWK